MKDYQKRAKAILEKFLDDLARGERLDLLDMAADYNVIKAALEERILELASIESLSRNKLYELERYQKFLLEVKYQLKIFSKQAAKTISAGQTRAVKAGIETVENILRVNLGSFPREAVKMMVGMSRTGTPLYDLLIKSYPDTVQKITNTLLEGTALGRNPIAIARDMAAAMDGNLTRAMVICRTEELNAYREASREAMKDSGMVDEWEWSAEPDACDDCLEQDGKAFPVDAYMDTHPNCRCALLPVISK